MSLKKQIKRIQMRLFPPSSRSFHGATYDIRQDIHRLQQELTALQQQLSTHTEQLHSRMDSLSSDLSVHDTHMKLYNDVFFREAEETPHEMRKRFFRALPDADQPFRTFQIANAKLLHQLEDICKENHLDYWLWVGSLVGAASRNSPIPWDDDIDICMMREDAMKLYDLLKSDPEYQMTLVYDYFVFVKQFRFSHRDPNIPCFIDISLWDWAADTSENNELRLKELRHQLIDALPECRSGLSFWRDNPYLFAPDSGFVVQCGPVNPGGQDPALKKTEIERIETYYRNFHQRALDAGILCAKEKASAIAFGLENYSEDAPWRRFIWPKDMVFPTQEIIFEQKPSRAPHDIAGFCDECYPGWPYLPKDILGHDHFSRSLLENPEIFAAMTAYISE